MQRRTCLAAPVLLALAAGRARAEGRQRLDFTIRRNGATIGTHMIGIAREGGATAITIVNRITVRLGFITLYRFSQDASERWEGDRLVAMTTRTDDDGTPHAVDVRAGDGGLVVRADGRATRAPAEAIPDSFWNGRVVTRDLLINTRDGRLMRMTVQDLGPDTVTVAGAAVAARHWRLTGGETRELWYDAEATLARVRHPGADGSEITWER